MTSGNGIASPDSVNQVELKKKIEEARAGEKDQSRWYHINRTFLPLKLAYFWTFSANYTIQPLLTLQMNSLGLTTADVAQVSLFMIVASILAPIVIGWLADRTSRVRELYIGCLVAHCLLHHMLLYVPVSAHTTPAALAASANVTRRLPCADWPPPACGSLTRSLECTLLCEGAGGTGSGGRLLLCPAQAGACREAAPAAVLHLQLGADGCQLPAALDNGSSQLASQLSHAELRCPAGCQLECAPAAALPTSSRRTYWIYFWLRMAATFFMKPTFTLLDATNLALVKEFGEGGQNFGRQRAMAILATVITPPLVGLLIDFVSGDGPTDYRPAFYVTDVCALVAIATVFIFRLNVTLPEKPHLRQMAQTLKRPEVLILLLVVTFLGAMWGFLESFLFVFLKELNAPTYMLGLTMTVAGVASLPTNWWSEAITKRVGHVNVLIIAFFCYVIRYVGYPFIRNPWLCFPFELLEVVTTHLMWNSAATYTGQLAPPGLLATIIGVCNMLHFNAGRGLGGFVGGYLLASYGTVTTYLSMAAASGIAGITYAMVYYCCLHRHVKRREDDMQRAKEAESTMQPGASTTTIITNMVEEGGRKVESTKL